MPVSRQELGRRLRVAREARGLTQEDVAEHLDVSRPTVAQMELGNRAVTSLELDWLARLYGRDLREFLVDENFQEHDALAALFRADSDVAQQSHVVDALRNCVTIGREVTNLERLLGIDREGGAAAVYPLPPPRTRWQAVQQGERVAGQERQRLGLGFAPLGTRRTPRNAECPNGFDRSAGRCLRPDDGGPGNWCLGCCQSTSRRRETALLSRARVRTRLARPRPARDRESVNGA